MNAGNSNDAASRKAVTEQLRRFFGYLTTQLAAGTTEIWARVEGRLAEKTPAVGSDVPPSSHRQPVQQQQSRAKPGGEK